MRRAILILALVAVLGGCAHEKACPPTTVCPTPPKALKLPPLTLCIEQQPFQKGDKAGDLLKCLEGDLIQTLNRIDDLERQLNAYR